MTKIIDVSVIVPVYNVEKYLKGCVDSILNQTHRNIEILLVDDGSQDRSGEICDALAKQDDRIRVIHQENAGAGFARNAGLDLAQGRYICFVDPDDDIEPDLIADNLKMADETCADITVFGFFKEKYGKDGEVMLTETRLPLLDGYYDYDGFRTHFDRYCADPFQLWNRLYRRSLIETHHYRFTDQKIGQDAIFNLEIYRNPFSVVFHKKAYYHYIIRNNSATMRYQPEREYCELNIARKMDALIQSFGFSDHRYDALITNGYIRALNIILKNQALESCPLSFREKKMHLRKLLQIPEIRTSLKKVKLSAFSRRTERIKVFLLKCRMDTLVLIFGEWKVKIDQIGL